MPSFATHRRPARPIGLTLVECLLAMAILAVAILGITIAVTAGQKHLQYGETRLAAARLAEHLLEEIQSRPYAGHGAGRSSYHVDDYDGFHESPGEIKDAAGTPYGSIEQQFSRSVSVRGDAVAIPAWEGAVVAGKLVVVTLEDACGERFQLSRFISPEMSP